MNRIHWLLYFFLQNIQKNINNKDIIACVDIQGIETFKYIKCFFEGFLVVGGKQGNMTEVRQSGKSTRGVNGPQGSDTSGV